MISEKTGLLGRLAVRGPVSLLNIASHALAVPGVAHVLKFNRSRQARPFHLSVRRAADDHPTVPGPVDSPVAAADLVRYSIGVG